MMKEYTRITPMSLRCPICGIEVEVATLVEMDNIHHINTYPDEMHRIFHLINYWKSKIPKSKINLDKIHIHYSITNLDDAANMGDLSSYLRFYKDGQECVDAFDDVDAIYLQFCPGLGDDTEDDQLESVIIDLLVRAAFYYKLKSGETSGHYISSSGWEALVDATCDELIAEHGPYVMNRTEDPE